MGLEKDFEEFIKNLSPEIEREFQKKPFLFCMCCGEEYNLNDFDDENPLEICGECGCELFSRKSDNPLIGFKSLGHYRSFIELIPERLRKVPETIYELEEHINYKEISAHLSDH